MDVHFLWDSPDSLFLQRLFGLRPLRKAAGPTGATLQRVESAQKASGEDGCGESKAWFCFGGWGSLAAFDQPETFFLGWSYLFWDDCLMALISKGLSWVYTMWFQLSTCMFLYVFAVYLSHSQCQCFLTFPWHLKARGRHEIPDCFVSKTSRNPFVIFLDRYLRKP